MAPRDLCFFHGRVSAWVDSGNFYFVDGVAINGVSGGPAFHYSAKTDSVRLVGLISAYVVNRATGEALPGLMVARDLTHLHKEIRDMKSIEEETRKMKKATAMQATEPKAGTLSKSEE